MLRGSGAGGADGADHPSSRTVTKPSLLAVTRAVEQWALATPDDPPLLVVALFQRAPYFARSLDVYARLAQLPGVTVAAFAGDPPSPLPEGLVHVRLDDREPLTREWSVTVTGPRSGATVVAQDLERVDGAARSLERGRLFTARWSFRRTTAVPELRRLRAGLGPRLPARAELDSAFDRAIDALDAPPDAPPDAPDDAPDTSPDTSDADEDASGAGRRQDAAMSVVLDRLATQRRRADRALGRLDDLVAGAERDPRSGLPTRAFLDRWTAGSASGTLPVGLALLRVHELSLVRVRHGVAVEREVLEAVARVLRGFVVGADRVVRVGREEFLLVLPSRGTEQLARWTERARAEIGALSGAHPFVPTPASAVITRTRVRPLPLGPLWAALDRAVETGVPITHLGE